jgi:hypothetical protein
MPNPPIVGYQPIADFRWQADLSDFYFHLFLTPTGSRTTSGLFKEYFLVHSL